MYKKNRYLFSVILICFSLPLSAMEFIIPLAMAACTKVMYEKTQSTFSIDTSDNHTFRLSPTVMSHCLRLNAVLPLFYKNYPKKLKVDCTKADMKIFTQAIENPTHINYNRDLNIIMKIAHAFGAYTLYAYCVSNYLKNIDGFDFDTKHITPLLKELTDNTDSEFILSRIVQLKDLCQQTIDVEDIYYPRGNHYLINVDKLASPMGRIYKKGINYEPYRIINKNKEILYEFKSYNCHMHGCDGSVGDLATPYLFATKPCVLYFDENTLAKAILYNFENKTEIAIFESHTEVHKIYVSENEQYIIVQSKDLNAIFVYNIHDIANIQCKKITAPDGIRFDDLTLSHDSKHLVVTEHNENKQHNALHYNLSNWDWSNENYIPRYTVISTNSNGYKEMLFHEDTIFLVHNTTTTDLNLEIINIKQDKTIKYPGTWRALQSWDKRSPYNKLILYNTEHKGHDTRILHFYTLKDGALSPYNTFTVAVNSATKAYELYSNHSNHIALENKRYNTTTVIHYNDDSPALPKKEYTIPGQFINMSSRGWTIIKSADNTSLFNSKGKQIINIQDGSYLSHIFCDGIGTSLCVNKTKKALRLYESQDPEKCNALYKDIITCEQYALIDTFCSDDDKYRYNKKRSIQNDHLLLQMMKSFPQEHKNFIQEKLKITQ